MDLALQRFYRIAYQTFIDESNVKVIQDTNIGSFCDPIASQFKKAIHNSTLNDKTLRNALKNTQKMVSTLHNTLNDAV